MTRGKIAELIKLNTIFQAPMAGVTTPELVSEVSNQGGIGNIGAGYLNAKQTQNFIEKVKMNTNYFYGINLFVPEKIDLNEVEFDQAKQKFKQAAPAYAQEIPEKIEISHVFAEQIEVVMKEAVPIVSFTFGIPDVTVIEQLKQAGSYIIGTATTVKEAIEIENAGCDAVVVQGFEAGGHRGSFLGDNDLIGLFSLLPQVADSVKIPIIAAGGIMDKRGVKAAYNLGASSVQLGTAFLMTYESSADKLHKKTLLSSVETDAVLTKAFSGKLARGINNEFIEKYKHEREKILPYPFQNSLTKNMRSLAKQQNDKSFMSLWTGQSIRLSKEQSVRDLMNELKK
ncbi:MAG TPA: nitronate monooxygenase [Pseudogracilibacillus sp.]|nr:nitronate monooxygenase [Pseudogracilibacillus sp.]